MLPEGLFAVRSLHERCLEQVIQAQFDTLLHIVAVLLDLDDDVFHTGGLGILEDGIEPDGMKIEAVIRVINDIAAEKELVGLTVAEPMPRTAIRLRDMLGRLPLLE